MTHAPQPLQDAARVGHAAGRQFNGRNAGADRIGERVAVGDGSHASDALICAAMHASTTRRINREIGARPSAISTYGCTKSRVGASDAGSIPATSTTTGVHGFDGALIRDGQPAMVPAASGSPLSRGPVRWAKSKLPTTTAITSSALRDVPAGRGVTNAGTLGGSNALKPKHSDRQRPARFAAGLCRLPRPFSSL